MSWSDGRTLFGLVSMLDYAAAVTFVFGPVARAAADATMRVPGGVGGQLVLGALLGVVWTPCTGPALAAAIALAARSESLAHAGGVMFLFGLGTVTPLLALAYGSRRALAAGPWVTRLGAAGRTVIGSALVVVGVLALAGADKAVEAWLVDRMPSWLLDLTTLL
ncbi:MAG: sulfite exporter TauE/SafE family protein [Candidatus Rokubacteria bacterium]|nr:sulfite exporter TauE/SafE family protein [Candidatus Rokubacteria bacterium]